uniref:Magnesium transporter protein 1 n=1 Tax=Romanomermis culicivorax TaxID=13658 RepID=A0A915K9X7_ROMCU
TLEERVSRLQTLLTKKPVFRFSGDDYRNYIRSAPRNYSVILMLTTLNPSRGCQICQQAHQEYQIVANSYRYANMFSKQLYFAMVDFDDASDVFQALNINSAPVLIHFPAKGRRKSSDTMDISRYGFGAEAVAKFVHERTDVQIRVIRPPSYAGPAAFLLLFVLVGGLLYMKRNNLDFLYNRTAWGIAALCIIFAFLSGQMWNHIRGPPFMHRNPQTGQMAYISGSSQMQFVVETYIVMLMYIAVTVGFILMNEAIDMKGDATKKRVTACVGLGVVVVFFSLILSIFRSKYSGYPYSFLFK